MTEPELFALDATQAAAIAALHEDIIGGGWSAASITQLLALPSAFGFAARTPGRHDPIGFILCLPAGDAVDIAALGIAAPFRRRGIASRLVLASCKRARQHGAAALMLEVAADNRPALALYGRLGFAAIAQRKDYYKRGCHAACDAVVLQRKLIAPE